ncbi:MAG: hypothetical protein HY959_09555 [Ignavibacteriae bacterium]|nr:hypothetical protein [Ignavibacteriota bacterium]
MKLQKIFIAVLFFLLPLRIISQGNSDSTDVIKFSSRIPLELELAVKVKEVGAIGYANCFRGEVISVLKGKMNDKKLLITAMDTLFYGILSRADENDILNINFVFNKANEPYSTTYITGFVDSDKNSWRITGIVKL